jgi:hypothetical protein
VAQDGVGALAQTGRAGGTRAGGALLSVRPAECDNPCGWHDGFPTNQQKGRLGSPDNQKSVGRGICSSPIVATDGKIK